MVATASTFPKSPKTPACPVCHKAMRETQRGRTAYFFCSLHGVFAPIAFFTAFKSTMQIARDLMASRRFSGVTRQPPLECPQCKNRMLAFRYVNRPSLEIDECLLCNGTWFDVEDFAQMPQAASDLRPPGSHGGLVWPSEGVTDQTLTPSMWLGLPHEEDHGKSAPPFAVATFILILVSLAFTLKGLRNVDFIMNNAFFALDPLRNHGRTIFASIFLHEGWLHFGFNCFFLYICGDNVEELEGPIFTAFLFIASAAAGNLVYAFSHSPIPTIGASGGVVGIMTFYAFAFPKNRFRIPYFPTSYRHDFFGNVVGGRTHPPVVFNITAPWALFLFLAPQFLYAYLQLHGHAATNTNYLAHLGGAAFGFVAWLYTDIQRSATRPTMQ